LRDLVAPPAVAGVVEARVILAEMDLNLAVVGLRDG